MKTLLNTEDCVWVLWFDTSEHLYGSQLHQETTNTNTIMVISSISKIALLRQRREILH